MGEIELLRVETKGEDLGMVGADVDEEADIRRVVEVDVEDVVDVEDAVDEDKASVVELDAEDVVEVANLLQDVEKELTTK